jgi:hypothetical protein
MRTLMLEELTAVAPTSIDPGAAVVTAGRVRLLTAAELAAVVAVEASGLVLLTPLYRAIPALPVVADENVQV